MDFIMSYVFPQHHFPSICIVGKTETVSIGEVQHRVTAASDDSREGFEDPDESVELVSRSCSTCKNCPICCLSTLCSRKCFTSLVWSTSSSSPYPSLKWLVRGPSPPWNSWRTAKEPPLTQENLEAFLLNATEKEIILGLDKDDIIDKMAESSKLLRHLLVH